MKNLTQNVAEIEPITLKESDQGFNKTKGLLFNLFTTRPIWISTTTPIPSLYIHIDNFYVNSALNSNTNN